MNCPKCYSWGFPLSLSPGVTLSRTIMQHWAWLAGITPLAKFTLIYKMFDTHREGSRWWADTWWNHELWMQSQYPSSKTAPLIQTSYIPVEPLPMVPDQKPGSKGILACYPLRSASWTKVAGLGRVDHKGQGIFSKSLAYSSSTCVRWALLSMSCHPECPPWSL